MDQKMLKALDKLSDLAHDQFTGWITSEVFADLKKALHAVASQMEEKYSVTLEFNVTVFDSKREKSLRMLTTGLHGSGSQDPYQCYGDSTYEKYLVNGEMSKVPGDYCPNCWGEWDFKMKQRQCPECKVILGKEVKLLIDRNICPHCGKGQVTVQQPTCSSCDTKYDTGIVAWG